MKKRTFAKNTWHDLCDQLFNYITKPIKRG